MTIPEIEKVMRKATKTRAILHVIDTDGYEYTGEARSYNDGDNEDDGYATVCIMESRDNENWCLGSNEIESIEIL